MSTPRRTFKRDHPDNRKEALIRATLTLMAEHGPSAATVRAIAEEAGITQGMIRHYFTTKEELVNATYEAHMAAQIAGTEAAEEGGGSARARLARVVKASLTPPVLDPRGVSLWAGFIHMVRRDPAMQKTHRDSYLRFRDRLEDLIREALAETGRDPAPKELRRLAIACNGVLDGLWLEGGALPEAFDSAELVDIGLQAIEALTGLDLTVGGEA